MPLSRPEGYRRGAGKEEAGLVAAEHFFKTQVGVVLERITDPEENYLRGDFVSPSGASLECKRQPISDHYRQNFVEVCEATGGRGANAEAHADGFRALGDYLALEPSELRNVRVADHNQGEKECLFGQPGFLSVSITSLRTASYWIYVNPGSLIYVYPTGDLLGLIREAVARNGMGLGVGKSNEVTYSVFLPKPAWQWRFISSGGWSYSGSGDEAEAVAEMQATLL